LPAAAELARRGHTVTLLDTHGPANPYASSSGPTRLWRLTHPDRVRVRLGRRAVEAWRRLEARAGEELLLRRGLLWRDDSADSVAATLAAEDVAHVAVAAAEVGRWLPGLRPNAYDAVWQGDAGPVLAARALAAQLRAFEAAAGAVVGEQVVGVEPVRDGVRLFTPTATHACDVVVLAPGPWASTMLEILDVRLPLEPVLEQVTYLTGRDGWLDLPCLVDGEAGGRLGMYAMPTPGVGYKIGLDSPLRGFAADDRDRRPDPELASEIARRAVADLGWPAAEVVGSQVCSWTNSPDGRFVVDRLLDGRVVLACGDSGEGFKFSALMGELLADLAEGASADPDLATFGLARFALT
jgi:glycine/D-amino acid oxidase-like deaminating enzyme